MDTDVDWVSLLGAHVIFVVARKFVVEFALESFDWSLDGGVVVHWRYLRSLRKFTNPIQFLLLALSNAIQSKSLILVMRNLLLFLKHDLVQFP